METHTFIAAAAFGLEGLAARECKRLGLTAAAENGGARFQGTFDDAFRTNLCLRTADRVLMILAEREVYTFEDLYQLMNGIPWEQYAAPDANLHISGKCVRSQLMSVRDCQAVGKKAAVERLMRAHHTRRAPETGAEYPVHIDIVNNVARISLDMSGDALNRRGYRTWNGEAPLRETLAAALVELSPWKPHIPLYDACCGTGTLLIEAAMSASHRAPGIHRTFACEKFSFMSTEHMRSIRAECAAEEKTDAAFSIMGSDIDTNALALCRKHIDQAGFTGRIEVRQQDLRTLTLSDSQPGVFLMNPPYGERLSDQNGARELYREMGKMYSRHPGWSLCAITADPAFERWFGRRADQKRRLYNGRLECDFYIYKV